MKHVQPQRFIARIAEANAGSVAFSDRPRHFA
jgi:hypothetical protein